MNDERVAYDLAEIMGPRPVERRYAAMITKKNFVAALMANGHHGCYIVGGDRIPMDAILIHVGPCAQNGEADTEGVIEMAEDVDMSEGYDYVRLVFEHPSFAVVEDGQTIPVLLPQMKVANPCPVCGGERPQEANPRSRLAIVRS